MNLWLRSMVDIEFAIDAMLWLLVFPISFWESQDDLQSSLQSTFRLFQSTFGVLQPTLSHFLPTLLHPCRFAKLSPWTDLQYNQSQPLCSYFDSCDKRNGLYSLTSNSLISTSNRSAIFSKLLRSGWDELVHHLLTVDGVTPSCSDNQRAVRFFSNSTIFIRLISSISIYFDGTKIVKIIQFLSLCMKLSYRFGTFLWF